MTSATDVLRRMLDERGVEWWQSANTLGCIFTRWHSPIFGDEVVAMENGGEGLVLFDHFVTPEQAIAATLGSCNCSSNCTNGERTGTCRNAAPSYLDFLCSECGFVHYHSDTNDTGDGNEWRYCPECGRRIEQ